MNDGSSWGEVDDVHMMTEKAAILSADLSYYDMMRGVDAHVSYYDKLSDRLSHQFSTTFVGYPIHFGTAGESWAYIVCRAPYEGEALYVFKLIRAIIEQDKDGSVWVSDFLLRSADGKVYKLLVHRSHP